MQNKRVAIVTGAARGIGLAIARRLHDDGCAVALADIDVDQARVEASSIGEGAMPLDLDVADGEACERGVAEVVDRFGGLDVLVNNAGIGGDAHPVDGYPIDMWLRVMAINLNGVFLCCRAVLPHMLAKGRGWIVNVASIAGKEGNPNMCAYSASKAGVIGFTKSLGKEVAQKGVIVNCVTPAVIETEILLQLNQQAVDYMVARIPMGRTGKPEEVAALVSWLSSPECSFTTGGVFDISGGRATY
jgi:2-dehydro-3-deoxy-L-rhamnonate dehydrogenase (NAD+)